MGDALDDKSAERPRPPKRRRRWLSYSLRGLFVLVFIATLPAWWLRNQLDAFAAEHEAIELLRRQGATVYTMPAEPEWLWKHFPGGTTPPRVVPGRPGPGRDSDDDQPPAAIDRREFARNFRSRFARRGSRAAHDAPGQPGSGATRRNGISHDVAEAGDAAASLEARTRRPRSAGRAGAKPGDAPASRNGRNANRQRPGGPALLLREHATMVHLPRGKGDDAQMKLVARLKHLEHLSIYHGKITDAGLANCAGLRNLVGLGLDGCKSITDDGLRRLRGAEKLKSLQLNSTPVGDRGVAFVAELPAIRWLLARDTEIGNNGLRQIARIESLECLDLTGTRFDDVGVGELRRCKKLRKLHLPIGVTAAGLAKLSPLKELTMLSITANSESPLTPFQKLESLHVRLRAVDDGSALREVKRLPKLRSLSISGDGITDATLRSLKGALQRQCHITVTGGRISETGARALALSLARGSTLHLEESPLGYGASARLHGDPAFISLGIGLIVHPKSDVGSPFGSRKPDAGAGRGGFGGERGQAIEKQATEPETLGAMLDE